MEPQEKKAYNTPEIILETELETKTGSPLDLPGADPFELPDFEG